MIKLNRIGKLKSFNSRKSEQKWNKQDFSKWNPFEYNEYIKLERSKIIADIPFVESTFIIDPIYFTNYNYESWYLKISNVVNATFKFEYSEIADDGNIIPKVIDLPIDTVFRMPKLIKNYIQDLYLYITPISKGPVKFTFEEINYIISPIARYSAKGRTNQDINREILPDLTGKGNDLILYNFYYSQMSGYGGFNGALTPTTSQNNSLNYKTITSNKIEIVGIKNDITITETTSTNKNFFVSPGLFMNKPGKIKVTIECDYPVEVFLASEGGGTGLAYMGFRNGTKEVEHTTYNRYLYGRFSKIAGGNDVYPATDSFKLTIEIPAEYPDGLVLDGINNFCVNKNFPILTDYTIICKRKTLYNIDTSSNRTLLSKWISSGENASYGAFIVDQTDLGTIFVRSFGSKSDISSVYEQDGIISQSSKKYNDLTINKGVSKDTNILILGAGGFNDNNNSYSYFYQGVVYDLIIYDKSLTNEEIQEEINKYIEKDSILLEDNNKLLLESNGTFILE